VAADPQLQAPLEALIEDAAAILGGHRLAVLTGAGLSTDSGIPDYRGPDSPPRTPMTYEQFRRSADFRRHYWARNHVGWQHVHRTQPNDGHRALARLERDGVVAGLITQNVDRLHSRAGSSRVIDLHGTYATVVCLDCGERITREALAERLSVLNPDFGGEVRDIEVAPDADAVLATTAGFRVADCASCGGILKPDIVYFGENVPRLRVDEAYALVDATGALLVAGSSLTVQSGLRFVRHAAKAGKPIVIVNRGATRGDEFATLTVDGGCSEVLSRLADLLPAALGAS